MKSYSADAIASAVKAVQFGDLVTVRMLLVSGQVSASSVDNDGCSLLHWAAINNRVAITNLLIQNGAVVPCAGGVLAESPLHWAVRRGFLRITDLLLNNGADLTYRSSLGLDVLNLSTRLGLLNTVFYLLAKGADPDSRPPDGDSPLLWCLKNRSSVPPDLVRLLLRQGADPCVPDNDGNTAYHVLAAANEEIDSTVWAALYAAGAQKAFWVRNKEGRYPYQVALESKNVFMIRCLWDVWVHQYVSGTISGACTVLSILIVPYCLHFYGLMKGAFITFLAQVLFFDKVAMPHVHPVAVAFNFYVAVGVAISLFFLYLVYIKEHVSTLSNVLLIGGAMLSIGLWYLCVKTPPRAVPHTSINDVLHDAVDLGPIEGPEDPSNADSGGSGDADVDSSGRGDVAGVAGGCDDEEAPLESESHGLLTSRHGNAANSTSSGDNGSNTNISSSFSSGGKRRRRRLSAYFDAGLPRDPFVLCTTCIGDKGMGTHCFRCGKCVVDMDHHCLVTMTCVGRGNRRLHLLFQAATACVCLLYLILALHVEHFVHCSDASGILWGLVAVQQCIWSSDPAFAAVPIVLVLLINYATLLAMRLLRNVLLETTVVDVNKRRNRLKSLSHMTKKDIFHKIASFLLTGKYALSRRSVREVEDEERREAAEAAETAARIQELRLMHQGRYRQGSFDIEDPLSVANSSIAGTTGSAGSSTISAIGQFERMERR